MLPGRCRPESQLGHPKPKAEPNHLLHKEHDPTLHGEDREVILFTDLHGHSRKMNVFMYGCENRKKASMRPKERIFPRILWKNSSIFPTQTVLLTLVGEGVHWTCSGMEGAGSSKLVHHGSLLLRRRLWPTCRATLFTVWCSWRKWATIFAILFWTTATQTNQRCAPRSGNCKPSTRRPTVCIAVAVATIMQRGAIAVAAAARKSQR